jgi:predicted acylesterase/phospholipase RssA
VARRFSWAFAALRVATGARSYVAIASGPSRAGLARKRLPARDAYRVWVRALIASRSSSSGGASLGAVQVGMLRALYERGIVPESGLRRLIAEHTTNERLEQTPIEFHVVAVDVLTGEERLLSRGPLLEAALASAAIPAVLPPVVWEGRTLMDGGPSNNTPISHAVPLGARTVYVLAIGQACALEQPPASALGMAVHALTLLAQSRLIADIENHRDRARLVVMPPPCPLAIQPTDFAHADELIGRSRDDARAFLDRGGAEGAPSRMRIQRHARPHARKKRAAGVALATCERSSAGWTHRLSRITSSPGGSTACATAASRLLATPGTTCTRWLT